MHVDNKNKDILIIGKGLTQGLDNSALAVEVEYSIILLNKKITFV